MNGIRPGDIVEVEKGGIRYLGSVVGKAAGVLDLEPVAGSCPSTVKARQVRNLWRKVRK